MATMRINHANPSKIDVLSRLTVTGGLSLSAAMIGSPLLAQTAPAAPTAVEQPAVPAKDAWLAELDPDRPLAPMEDIGVPWPDFDTPIPDLPPLDPPVVAEAPLPVPPAQDNADAAALAELPLPPAIDVAVGDAAPVLAEGTDAMPAAIPAEGLFDYRVELGEFGPAADRRFRSRFAAYSRLDAEDGDPANAAQLARRIDEDGELLDRLLRNDGYFDATVQHMVLGGGTVTVRFSADAGPRYTYSSVVLPGFDAVGAEERERLDGYFPIRVGNPVSADKLIAAQIDLEREMRDTGYPFANVGEEDVLVDHDRREADLTQPITPGPRLRFGAVLAQDDGLLGARHIQRIARFDPGEWYSQALVEDLRRALIATGLVASVGIEPVQASDPAAVDLNVSITPAPLRTLAGAIGYGTGEGFRAEASWEHRNLFPPEGALILRGVAGTQEQLASVTFRRSNFMVRDRVLAVQALASHQSRAAYDARTLILSGRLERQSTLLFQKLWSWSVGAELIATDERSIDPDTGVESREAYYVAAAPLFLGYDRTEDLLDPTSGFRLSASVSPEASLRGNVSSYVRVRLDGSYYYPASRRVVLAGRLRFGSIVGAPLSAIAPSRRLYAGGGGSVRGYGYQQIGARDINGDPTGGRSLFEAAAEARVRLGVFSVVPFVDVGNVQDAQLPSFSALQFGAGIGVRYHSSFGPLRVDVATPINRRPGDSRIAVYVSLGQAF